jgi:outer membrane lipoprotein SlyB
MYADAQTVPDMAFTLGIRTGEHMKHTYTTIVLMVATTAFMGGCANDYSRPAPNESYSRQTTSQSYAHTYGVIESIDVVSANDPGIAGTVIGGVIGGVLGNQIGGGTGKTAATIVGAAGGAVVGHEIEANNQGPDQYQVTVNLGNGRLQTVTQDDITDLHVGSRVTIENNHVYRD